MDALANSSPAIKKAPPEGGALHTRLSDQTATGCSMIPVGTSANITEER